jgi:hypothetical protein
MESSWKDDAHFVGAFVRGGDWEIGLRVARNVTPNNKGGRPKTSGISEVSGRVSLVEFAKEAGVHADTIAKYLAAWEWAALERVVDPSAELGPDDFYDWKQSGPTPEDWKFFYKKACQNPPPWNPYGKPMEPRKYPERNVGKDQIAGLSEAEIKERYKTDAKFRRAVNKAHRELAEERAAERAAAGIEAEEDETILDGALALADAAVEEGDRRWDLKAIVAKATSIHEDVNAWVESYDHTGVPDEVDWIRQASSELTEAQWKLNAAAVESAEEGAR